MPAPKKGASDSADSREHELIANLNGRYDEINKLWTQAEQRLKRFPIPTDVHVVINSNPASNDPREDRSISEALGYVKSCGGWRICFGTYHDGYPDEDWSWKPLLDCSLDVRISAIPHLTKLKGGVVEAAEKSIATLDAGISELRDAVSAI